VIEHSIQQSKHKINEQYQIQMAYITCYEIINTFFQQELFNVTPTRLINLIFINASLLKQQYAGRLVAPL
jgi:hypothetical protein